MNIQSALIHNGHYIRVCQLKGQSLHAIATEVRILERNRNAARKAGYTWAAICQGEMLGVLGAPLQSGRVIDVVFAYEDAGMFGLRKRMYNVNGLYLNQESTVDCAELLARRLVPNDINGAALLYHGLKAWISNLAADLSIRFYELKERVLKGVRHE